MAGCVSLAVWGATLLAAGGVALGGTGDQRLGLTLALVDKIKLLETAFKEDKEVDKVVQTQWSTTVISQSEKRKNTLLTVTE